MNEESKSQGVEFWEEHYIAWKTSGLSQEEYCIREEISYQKFLYQRKNAGRLKRPAIKFIEAKIKSVPQSQAVSGLHLILPNGARINFDGEITTILIQTIIKSAGDISC